MGESMETRLALGRHIEVGNLYDVRQDKELVSLTFYHLSPFQSSETSGGAAARWPRKELPQLFESNLHISLNNFSTVPQIDTIFKASPDAEQIECKDLGLTEYKYVVTKSTQDKLQLLNIHGELSASLMGGLIEVSGSASYLKDTRKKMNSSSMTCRLNVQTKQEKIFLRADDLRAKVDMTVLENHPEATHVVTSVLYGATGLVEAKFEFSDAQEEEKIKGSLGAKFQKMGMKIEGQIDIETDQHDIATDERFSFSWKCDVMDDNSNLPVTFEEAVKKMTSLPSLIKGSGDGKGVPLKVWLMPLSQVAEMFKQELQAHAIYQTISGDSLVEIMSYYTKLENNILELKDIVHDLTEDKSLVHSRKVQEAQEALTAGEKEKAKLQGTLKQALLDIRSGKSTTQDLDEWIIQFQESVLADSRIQKTKNEFRLDVKNKKFMTEARKMGVMVLTEDDYLPDNLDGHDFVLYTDLFTEELQDTSNEHRKTFMQLRLSEENKKNSSEGDNENNFDKTTKFYWQDFNLCGKEGEIKIEERKYGNIIDSDVKQRYKDELGLNLVDMSSGSFWDAGKISKDAVDFKIRCPRVFKKGKTACSSGLPAWQCKFCKDPIIFDTRQEGDNKIGVITCKKCMKAYKVPITTDVAGLALFLDRLLFKCNDTANHGFSYEKYDDNDAKDFQAQMAKLVDDIMEKRGEIPDYFDGLDLDGDNKLTPEEAKPLLERLQALEVTKFLLFEIK